LTDAISNSFEVTQRAITLTAAAASKIYGEADPALSVSIDGGTTLAPGDVLSDVTGTLTRETGETVGVYDIALGTGSKAGNYDITFNTDNDAFSITKRAITLTAVAATKVYGEA